MVPFLIIFERKPTFFPRLLIYLILFSALLYFTTLTRKINLKLLTVQRSFVRKKINGNRINRFHVTPSCLKSKTKEPLLTVLTDQTFPITINCKKLVTRQVPVIHPFYSIGYVQVSAFTKARFNPLGTRFSPKKIPFLTV